MTLFRQLFIGTSITFLVLLAVVEGIYISNARVYMQQQLTSHAQDVATSLGLVLPPALADKDVLRAEITVNAVFDRGFYQSIVVLSPRGEKLVEKSLAPAPVGVPVWFTTLFPMYAPSAESLITKGWSQLGRVIVTSHPNFAYKQLWGSMIQATSVMIVLYLLALFAIRLFLKRILRPLAEIEILAYAITQREFTRIAKLPRARELRSVVRAINSMSTKLRDMIAHEVRQAIRFRDESRQDALTGLENRRGFEQHAHALLENGDDVGSGALFMLQLSDFQSFNIKNGYKEGDALLKAVAQGLLSVAPASDLLRCRINGATFVVLAFNIDRNDAVLLGEHLSAALGVPVQDYSSGHALTYGCGGVYFSSQKVTLTALLAQCDRLLLQAMAGGSGISLLEDIRERESGMGAQYWKNLVEGALEGGQVFLLAQSVKYFHVEQQGLYEVVGRIKNQQGELVPAGQFIPMADRYQLTPQFDLSVLNRLSGRMLAHGGDEIFAVNLSIHSIHDAELLSWLNEVMSNHPSVARRLVFEFTEFGLVQDRAGVNQFVADIRALGGDFAVDNFGLHHTAFEYLQSLKPKYIKLSPAYLRALQDNLENQFFISTVVNITRSLDIRTFVLGVEDVSVLPLLRELGVDGYQGYINGGMTEADSLEFGEITSHLVIDK